MTVFSTLLAAAAGLALVASADSTLEARWSAWKQEFGKTYATAQEDLARFQVFSDNVVKIEAHNADGRSWTMGMNQFGDLTADEFKAQVKCRNAKRNLTDVKTFNPAAGIDMATLPTSIDWSLNKSVVNPVKNQGSCGSCWAFSTVGSTESRYAIATGTLNSLSEQELVDCDETSDGCDGGEEDTAFTYVKDHDGLSLESAYPYKGRDTECTEKDNTHYNPVTGHVEVERDDADALMAAVAEGPVSVGVEADQSSFQFYDGGVMDGRCGCEVDHAVIVVGYGTESGSKYWKVRNSWGESWGMEGYINLCRDCDKNGDKGQCCVLSDPAYPTI